MPEISKDYYPNLRLDEAIGILTRVIKDYVGKVKVKTLQEIIGKKGGWFRGQLEALVRYGLLEKGSARGEYRASALAEKIVSPLDDAEGRNSKATAFLNIGLFNKIHQRLQGNVPNESDFARILEEITKASRKDVLTHSRRLRKFYIEAIPYLIPKVEKRMIEKPPIISQRVDEVKLPAEMEELKLGESIKIWIPKGDTEAAEAAKSLLDVYISKSKKKSTK